MDPDVALILLHYSSRLGRTDLIREALSNGADVNDLVDASQKYEVMVDDDDEEEEASAKNKSAKRHEKSKAPFLDQVPEFPEGSPAKMETALHAAVRSGAVDSVRTLLSAGAKCNIADYDNLSAVQLAEKLKRAEIMRALVAELCQCAGMGKTERITELVEAGLDPSLMDGEETENTALHWAAAFGSFESCKTLLELGANVDARNVEGITPLIDACHNSHVKVAELLLENGADASLKATSGPSKGSRAIDLVQNAELRKMLEKVSGKKSASSGGGGGGSAMKKKSSDKAGRGEKADKNDKGVEKELPVTVIKISSGDKKSKAKASASLSSEAATKRESPKRSKTLAEPTEEEARTEEEDALQLTTESEESSAEQPSSVAGGIFSALANRIRKNPQKTVPLASGAAMSKAILANDSEKERLLPEIPSSVIENTASAVSSKSNAAVPELKPASLAQKIVSEDTVGESPLDATPVRPAVHYPKAHEILSSANHQHVYPEWADCIWPKPQVFQDTSDQGRRVYKVRPVVNVKCDADSRPEVLKWFTRLSVHRVDFPGYYPETRMASPSETEAGIWIRKAPANFARPTESYRLVIRDESILITASDNVGIFYALNTLDQIFMLRSEAREIARAGALAAAAHDAGKSKSEIHTHALANAPETTIPTCSILDYPMTRYRAIMLDLSQGRVWTLSALCQIVDLLSRLKINQMYLRLDFAMDMPDFRQGRKKGNKITADDIMSLDGFCKEVHVELVPCQDSTAVSPEVLMSRNMNLEILESLADARRVQAMIQGREAAPSVSTFEELCDVNRRLFLNRSHADALDFLHKVYSSVLPCFSSEQVHVGSELQLMEHLTSEELIGGYLDFVSQLADVCSSAGRKSSIQFWSSGLSTAILGSMQFGDGLDTSCVAMEYIVNFDESHEVRAHELQQAGVPFYLCPSTLSQNSFAGSLHDCLRNIFLASKACEKYSATGLMSVDFGGAGHLQPILSSYPAFLALAGAAWNPSCAMGSTEESLELLARLLDIHIFGDGDEGGCLGSVLTMLGEVNDVSEHDQPGTMLCGHYNELLESRSSRLFDLVMATEKDSVVKELFEPGLRRSTRRVEKALEVLSAYRGRAPNIDIQELQLMSEYLRVACRLALLLVRESNGSAALTQSTRSDLVNRVIKCIDLLRSTWPVRSKSAGFLEAVKYLEAALNSLSGDQRYMKNFIETRHREGWEP